MINPDRLIKENITESEKTQIISIRSESVDITTKSITPKVKDEIL